jgi:uncharacterized protein YbaA (DUF1428 family)
MATIAGLSLFDVSFIGRDAGTQQVINAAGTKAAGVYVAPKAGNIRYIGSSFTALLDLRAETVSSNLPTGTLWGTNTNAAYSPVSTNTLIWTQLTADAVVSAGDNIAAVVAYTGGTSATCNVGANLFAAPLLPFSALMSGGSWFIQSLCPMVCLKYDDGTIIRGSAPLSQLTNSNIQSGTNPNERATVFLAPFGCNLIGARFPSFVNAGGAFTVNLYTESATSPDATITVAANFARTGTNGVITVYFASAVALVGGTTYRLSVKATAAANVNIERFIFPSTAERDATVGEMWSDTRNGSAWIGATTTTSEIIFPLFGSLDALGDRGIFTGGKM